MLIAVNKQTGTKNCVRKASMITQVSFFFANARVNWFISSDERLRNYKIPRLRNECCLSQRWRRCSEREISNRLITQFLLRNSNWRVADNDFQRTLTQANSTNFPVTSGFCKKRGERGERSKIYFTVNLVDGSSIFISLRATCNDQAIYTGINFDKWIQHVCAESVSPKLVRGFDEILEYDGGQWIHRGGDGAESSAEDASNKKPRHTWIRGERVHHVKRH